MASCTYKLKGLEAFTTKCEMQQHNGSSHDVGANMKEYCYYRGRREDMKCMEAQNANLGEKFSSEVKAQQYTEISHEDGVTMKEYCDNQVCPEDRTVMETHIVNLGEKLHPRI